MSINSQPKERIERSTGSQLDISNIFSTIQGEGPYSGQRALFVRLAGCNFQCPACDTDYTSRRRRVSLDELIEIVGNHYQPPNLVVITGGEPFRQNISPFANTLLRMGYHVQVETNGSVPFSDGLSPDVHIVCSPKSKSIPAKNLSRIDAFKYVIDHRNIAETDMLPTIALEHSDGQGVARPPEHYSGPIYVLPMDVHERGLMDDYLENITACKAACLKHGYIMQLQIHKIIEVE